MASYFTYIKKSNFFAQQNALLTPFRVMAQTIQNSIKFSQDRIKAASPSTLLIPKKLLNYFESRANFFGNRKLYFQHLIVSYGRHLHQFRQKQFSNKWKNKYQKPGLDLQPRHFTPAPEFWEEFRNLSLAYGLAMCKLFVVLLQLEYDRWIQAGKPENFCEKNPRRTSQSQSGMNSWQIYRKNKKNSLYNLVSGGKCTILLRKIDFSAMELERMAIIEQKRL